MKFLTQPLLATLVVVMVSTPTSAQTLPPSLSDAATSYDDGCSDQCGLLSAGSACGESCNGSCDGCGPCGCSCAQSRSCWSRRTGCLGWWASNAGGWTNGRRRQSDCCGKQADCCGGQNDCCSGQSDCCSGQSDCCGGQSDCCGKQADCCGEQNDCCGEQNDCCSEQSDCCGGQSDCCGGRSQSCGRQTGCRGRADCCGGCRGGRRSGGCFIGTLLGDVKQAVDTAVVGCTPWTDWRTPYSDESAYSYAGSNSVTQATEGVAAETHGTAAGMDRVTKGRDGVEIVPRDQWPAEYRDAPVPAPPNLTRSAIKLGPYGDATYQTRAPAMQLRSADGAADNGPAEQVTAWVADAEEPQQDDVTVVTDLNE